MKHPTPWFRFALLAMLALGWAAIPACGEDCEEEALCLDDDVYPVRENQSIGGFAVVEGTVTVEGVLATLELELEGGSRYRVVYRFTGEFEEDQ